MPGSRPTGMRTILGLLLAATLLSGCGGGPSGGDTQITVEPRLPGPTRTESYRGVEITVPASWGWAAAPVDQGGDLATCADPGAWPPSGEPAEGIPYVGRPTWTSDVCQAWQESEPDAPYAWLGVPLESGRRTYGDWTVETKVLHGVPVTVASKQEMQRLAILDSARVADIDSNGCPQGPGTTRPGSREGTGKPAHLSVCVYKATGRGPVELFASARVGATRAQPVPRCGVGGPALRPALPAATGAPARGAPGGRDRRPVRHAGRDPAPSVVGRPVLRAAAVGGGVDDDHPRPGRTLGDADRPGVRDLDGRPGRRGGVLRADDGLTGPDSVP